MAPPPMFQTLVDQFNAFLEPDNIALRSFTSREQAATIIDVLKKRVTSGTQPPGPDQQRLMQHIDAIDTVLSVVNIPQLAVDHDMQASEVRKILRVIWVAVRIFFEPFDHNRTRSTNIWSILSPGRQLATIGDTVWPPGLAQHATAVYSIAAAVRQNSMRLGPGLIAVALQDLDAVQHGAMLLANNLGALHRQFESAVTDAHGRQKTIEPMRHGLNAGSTSLQNPIGRREQPVGQPIVSKLSYLEIQNHVAQPIFPSALPRDKLPLRPIGQQQSRTPKHDLPRSPGPSPVKKKTKEDAKSLPVKERFDAYASFVLAERSRLEKAFPAIRGGAFSNLMYQIWSTMTPDEKRPFENLQRNFEQRGPHTTVAEKRNAAKTIPRCQTLMNATPKNFTHPNRVHRAVQGHPMARDFARPVARPALEVPGLNYVPARQPVKSSTTAPVATSAAAATPAEIKKKAADVAKKMATRCLMSWSEDEASGNDKDKETGKDHPKILQHELSTVVEKYTADRGDNDKNSVASNDDVDMTEEGVTGAEEDDVTVEKNTATDGGDD